MVVKVINVRDMQQAISSISREYGPDAVILTSRRTRKKGIRHLFAKRFYEVTVAYDPEKTPMALRSAQRRAAEAVQRQEEEPPAETGLDRKKLETLDRQIACLNEKLDLFAERFGHIRRNVTYDYPPEVEDLLMRMMQNQVCEELAHSLAKETRDIQKRKGESSAVGVMRQLITETIGVPERITQKKFQRKVVLFVGSTGVGKTTSIVKLAANFLMNERKKVGIINTDTYRIAAHEQLLTYAEILEIPLGIVYEADEVEKVLQEQQDRDIILIDTAGKRPGDTQHREMILKLLEKSGAEEIVLTISAPTSFTACREIIDSYAFLPDYKLLITKVDETESYGNILNICWYCGKKLTYLSTGQNVPDDIEQADPEKIVDRILKR